MVVYFQQVVLFFSWFSYRAICDLHNVERYAVHPVSFLNDVCIIFSSVGWITNFMETFCALKTGNRHANDKSWYTAKNKNKKTNKTTHWQKCRTRTRVYIYIVIILLYKYYNYYYYVRTAKIWLLTIIHKFVCAPGKLDNIINITTEKNGYCSLKQFPRKLLCYNRTCSVIHCAGNDFGVNASRYLLSQISFSTTQMQRI